MAQPQAVLQLLRRVKAELGLNVWLYTGYTWEQIMAQPHLAAILQWVDVVVDGPFVLAQRDTTLRFRGSANQRLINVPATLATGHLTLI